MSLFPLSALTTSQLHHPTNPMTASSSSDARGDQILVDTVEDRISELPDDVLVRILKDMTTEDVVKTSVLSQRWKDVWKKVPYLIFDMQKATIPNNMEPLVVHSDRVADSITEVINNHKGHLAGCTIRHYYHQCHDGVLETWIRLLTLQKQTRALSLSNLHANGRGLNLLELSPNAFSHPMLVSLFLSLYDIETPHAFNQCHNLMILKLDSIFAEVDVLNTVIASCPSLKVLVLHVLWYNARACLKIRNNNLKLLHVASTFVDCIEVSAALLDIFSIDYIFDGEYNFVIDAPRLLFTTNMERLPSLNYNISCDAQEMENFGNKFLLSRDANYFRRLKCLAVAVNVMNWKEVEMLRDVLVSWNGIMRELDILFKDKEEGETSIDGAQETMWEENLFPNADFRVKVVWMFNFSGSNEKQFELASRFITQGTVMKKMMIMSSSVPAKEKLDIEAAVAKLMKLPKGNKKLHIGCF
ncbi:hypothetical protein CARUB_v10021370mg [Capsella rubella]|uniref:F-box domain-containing protein n=1 Tax=Capsella rubella TaxID=81985 RepID=R0IB76_9BRAS|nr:putative F-box protein At1g67390 isoform X1 [Capsella rubella]EOA33878.1 hypothetical protein CARUB_v10021370mg [Capsella rubella]